MIPEAIEKEAHAGRERWLHFHWQNLNEKWPKGVERSERRGEPTLGWGLREGRCWWHFRSKDRHPGNTVRLEWNLWSCFCGIGFDIDDEDLTLHISFPPVAFWLSFTTHFKWIDRLAPKKFLDAVTYPDTIVVDERECGVKIHGGRLWINPWSKKDEWVAADPWWVKGVSFSVNPFELVHMRHEVRCRVDLLGSTYWMPYVGSWETDRPRDYREKFTYTYHYMLSSGEIQTREATVYVERRAWRPKCLKWTSLFEKVRTVIDIAFSDEVGERTGSWKGGTIGCSWELLSGETPEQALRRMEAVRKFN